MSTKCALCSLSCPRNPIEEGENRFCCRGCLTVFQILRTQKFQGDVHTHPLFQQALDSGILSNPELYEEMAAKEVEGEMMTLHLEIGEMWCPSCAEAIRLILMRQAGIKRCVVDYATDCALIEFSPRHFSKEELFAFIRRLGYLPQPLLSSERKPARFSWIRFAISAFCALNLMMIALPLYTSYTTDGYGSATGWLSFALALPLITYGAWPLWRRFLLSLRTRQFGMETLVLMGAGAAFSYSTYQLFFYDPPHLYYDSMGMLLTFVLLGKILEKRAKFSAKESLFRITRTLPKKGMKQLPSGEYMSVPLKDIKKGDTLLVRTGEKVVLDGVVLKGEGLVDASVMTGESMPLRVQPGASLVGGSLLKQGVLHIQVLADMEASILTRIFKIIEQDLGKKRAGGRLVDRLIPYFVPLVLLLACFAYPFSGFLRSLSVLLISCPCAIGIATPLAEARLLYRFAEEGALVRNREALAILAQDPLFVFDKTGTLTEGKFQVLSGLEQLDPTHKAILKGFSNYTTHPVVLAVGEALFESVKLDHVQEYVGRGMDGEYAGKRYQIGSSTFFKERGISVPSAQTTTVYFAEENALLATIQLGDPLREDIPQVDGVILSGDAPELVSAIAKQCGFQWGKGGCDPLQKRAEIEKMERPVVMVGDGVNDAPALSAADVGISVVSATDLSIEVSDILLTKTRLSVLPELVVLAKKGRRIIKQNLFWAFFYNGVGIGLALLGYLTPLFAVSAMLLSSLCVTLNSWRS